MKLDFNRAHISGEPLNVAINAVLDETAAREAQKPRPYLGASLVGDECLRKCQYTWQVESAHPARTMRIFARGHAAEETTAAAFLAAGFRLERGTDACEFSALDGRFKGHCDGIFRDGPPTLKYPCLWEHKCIGSKGWAKLEKNGLKAAYPTYYKQVMLYQAYMDLADNPALLTAMNADTCALLHILVPFDAETAQAISDRAVRIVEATEAHELLPRVADSADDWRCNRCSHRERCWA